MDNLSPDTAVALLRATENQADTKLRALKGAATIKDQATIEEAAKDFEALYITEMMKPMFEGIKPDDLFGGGKTEEIFQGLLLEEYGKLIAETGQLGIADAVKREMIKLQEEANGGTHSEIE